MSYTWLTAKIFLHQLEDMDNVIIRLIAPIVKEVEHYSWFKGFHFLKYNDAEGTYLRFRINYDSMMKDMLHEKIKNKMKEINNTSPIIRYIDFKEAFIEDEYVLRQEIEDFGQIGWDVLVRYLEYVSRTVIGLLSRPQSEYESFPIKYHMTRTLFHFLLNPLILFSFNGDGEVSAHLDAILERYIAHLSILKNQGYNREAALREAIRLTPNQMESSIAL